MMCTMDKAGHWQMTKTFSPVKNHSEEFLTVLCEKNDSKNILKYLFTVLAKPASKLGDLDKLER